MDISKMQMDMLKLLAEEYNAFSLSDRHLVTKANNLLEQMNEFNLRGMEYANCQIEQFFLLWNPHADRH